MISAVMLDLNQQETYLESFETEEDYNSVLNTDSEDRHPTSIFNNEKDAGREARRVADFSVGWTYNMLRNKLIKG